MVELFRAALARHEAQAERWPASRSESSGVDGDHLCVEDGHPVLAAAPGDGLWQRGDLLAEAPGLAGGGGLGPLASGAARPTGSGRRGRLVAGLAGDRESVV